MNKETRLPPLAQFLSPSSGVSQLPPEILGTIFSFCVSEAQSLTKHTIDPATWAVYLNMWSTITGVCRYWRTVALSTPSLWSVIITFDGHLRDYVEPWISRSARTPLSISIVLLGSRFNDEGLLDRVLRESARIQELNLVLDWSIRYLDDQPQQRADFLSRRDDLRYFGSTVGWVPCSKNLQAEFPCLRRFALAGFGFKIDQWTFPSSLTSLEIRNDPMAFGLLPNFQEILKVLRNLPLLEFLTLHHVIYLGASPPPDLPQIALPQLNFLSLSGLEFPILRMLRSLTYPSAAKVELELSIDRPRIRQLETDASISYISRLLHDCVNVRSLFVGSVKGLPWPYCGLVFVVWKDALSTERMKNPVIAATPGPASVTRLQFLSQSGEDVLQPLVRHLVQCISLEHIRTLHMGSWDPKRDHLILGFGSVGLLRRMRAVETLVIRSFSQHGLAEILDVLKPTTGEITLPALRLLIAIQPTHPTDGLRERLEDVRTLRLHRGHPFEFAIDTSPDQGFDFTPNYLQCGNGALVPLQRGSGLN